MPVKLKKHMKTMLIGGSVLLLFGFNAVLGREFFLFKGELLAAELNAVASGIEESSVMALVERYRLLNTGRDNTAGHRSELDLFQLQPARHEPATQAVIVRRVMLGMWSLFGYVPGHYTHSLGVNRDSMLQQALRHEMQRDYRRAAALYTDVLNDDSLLLARRRVIRLHRAFCLSLSGHAEMAADEYRNLSEGGEHDSLYPVSEAARQLLSMLGRGGQYGSHYGKQYGIQHNSQKPAVLFRHCVFAPGSRLRHFKAGLSKYLWSRCLEERGRLEDAAGNYLEIIRGNYPVLTRRRANRRVFLVSLLYRENKKQLFESLNRFSELTDRPYLVSVSRHAAGLDILEGAAAQRVKAVLAAPEGQAAKDPVNKGQFNKSYANKSHDGKMHLNKITEPHVMQKAVWVFKLADGTVVKGRVVSESKNQVVLKTALGTISLQHSAVISRKKEYQQ